MPIAFDFTCPNGHKFKAIAKLRARCPNCGQTTRRAFSATETKPSGVQTPSESSSPFSRKVAKPKTSEDGLTPVSDLKTEKPLKSGTKSSKDSPVLVKTLPRIVKQGRTPLPVKKQTPVVEKKVVAAVKSPTRRVSARKGTHPVVTKKPTGSRERKTLATVQEAIGEIPYWQKVKKKYFV